MQSPICAMLGIEFPLLAFSHCRDVVVAVSKAGGMGVFGAAALPPERLEEELADSLAMPVTIKVGAKNKGQLIIDFSDLEALDVVIARLKAQA